MSYFPNFYRGLVAILLLSIVLSLQNCRKVETTQQTGPEFRLDRFSGITVPNMEFAEAMVLLRNGNAPSVGEISPDGVIFDSESGDESSIYDLIGKKPLVLVFGSASCSVMDMYISPIADFCNRYSDKVDFSLVYIREAHPEGGVMPEVIQYGKPFEMSSAPDSRTLQERKKSALALKKRYSEKMRCFVDSMEDDLAVRWGAWPARVFVIGTDRKILYSGGQGPWYFQITRDGWHSPPPTNLEASFRKSSFSEISLEEFLETLSKK